LPVCIEVKLGLVLGLLLIWPWFGWRSVCRAWNSARRRVSACRASYSARRRASWRSRACSSSMATPDRVAKAEGFEEGVRGWTGRLRRECGGSEDPTTVGRAYESPYRRDVSTQWISPGIDYHGIDGCCIRYRRSANTTGYEIDITYLIITVSSTPSLLLDSNRCHLFGRRAICSTTTCNVNCYTISFTLAPLRATAGCVMTIGRVLMMAIVVNSWMPR
jgi:hypothetical protein